MKLEPNISALSIVEQQAVDESKVELLLELGQYFWKLKDASQQVHELHIQVQHCSL